MGINKHIMHTVIERDGQMLYVLFYDERSLKEITSMDKQDFNASHVFFILPTYLQMYVLRYFVNSTGLTREELQEALEQKSFTIEVQSEALIQCEECGGTDINRKGLCRHCGIVTKNED